MKMNVASISLVGFFLTISPLARADQLSINGSVSSAYLDHGIDISQNNPVINFNLSYDFAERFYLDTDILWGEKKIAPVLNRGSSVKIGFFYEIMEQQAIDFSITTKYFFGDFESEWNYNLLSVTYMMTHSFSAEWAFSDDYYGRGFASHYTGVNWRPSINDQLEILLSAGSTQYDKSNNNYRVNDVEIGIGYVHNRYRLELIYNKVSEDAAFIYDELAIESRFNVSLAYAIY